MRTYTRELFGLEVTGDGQPGLLNDSFHPCPALFETLAEAKFKRRQALENGVNTRIVSVEVKCIWNEQQ